MQAQEPPIKNLPILSDNQKSDFEKIEIYTEANFSEVEIFLKYLDEKNLKPKRINFRVAAYGNMIDIAFYGGEKVSLFVKKFNASLKNIHAVTDINNFLKISNVKINNIKIRQANENYEIDFNIEEIDEV